MRELQDDENLKLTDVLLPKYEKTEKVLQKAALMTEGQTDEESFSSPSNAIKLKHEVRRLAMTKWSEQCREERYKEAKETKLLPFQHLGPQSLGSSNSQVSLRLQREM